MESLLQELPMKHPQARLRDMEIQKLSSDEDSDDDDDNDEAAEQEDDKINRNLATGAGVFQPSSSITTLNPKDGLRSGSPHSAAFVLEQHSKASEKNEIKRQVFILFYTLGQETECLKHLAGRKYNIHFFFPVQYGKQLNMTVKSTRVEQEGSTHDSKSFDLGKENELHK